MAGHPPRVETGSEDAQRWPRACLRRAATIYHNGERRRDCDSPRRTEGRDQTTPGPGGRFEWVRDGTAPSEWVRDESISIGSPEVTAISGVEPTLTAVWVRLLLRGALEWPTDAAVVPFRADRAAVRQRRSRRARRGLSPASLGPGPPRPLGSEYRRHAR